MYDLPSGDVAVERTLDTKEKTRNGNIGARYGLNLATVP